MKALKKWNMPADSKRYQKLAIEWLTRLFAVCVTAETPTYDVLLVNLQTRKLADNDFGSYVYIFGAFFSLTIKNDE